MDSPLVRVTVKLSWSRMCLAQARGAFVGWGDLEGAQCRSGMAGLCVRSDVMGGWSRFIYFNGPGHCLCGMWSCYCNCSVYWPFIPNLAAGFCRGKPNHGGGCGTKRPDTVILEYIAESTHTSPFLTLRDTCSECMSPIIRLFPSDQFPDASTIGMSVRVSCE